MTYYQKNRFVIEREKLYEAIWNEPITQISKKNGLSYANLLKQCKEYSIPVPPAGYWTKLEFGKAVEKPPLPQHPQSEIEVQYVGQRKEKAPTRITPVVKPEVTSLKVEMEGESAQKFVNINSLIFLSEEERSTVLDAANSITLPPENEKISTKISKYHKTVLEWNASDRKPAGYKRQYANQPPFLAGVVSEKSLPRIYRMLAAIFEKVELLGGAIQDDLTMIVRGQQVRLDITESQTKTEHTMTRDEAKQMIQYEDDKRRHGWITPPRIQKYDYVFNGQLKIRVSYAKAYNDSKTDRIESRLGELFIEIYEVSEQLRIEQVAREKAEKERRLAEAERQCQKKLQREEIEKVQSLIQQAGNYQIACMIRAYAYAVESSGKFESEDWLRWAIDKSNWYDPTINRIDEILGKLDLNQEVDLERMGRSYYW